MTGAAPVQITTTKAPPSNSHSLLVQRKCACGGSSGLTGTCSDCETKKFLGIPLQTKLRVNEPGDEYEQEADRVAEQVMRMANATVNSKTSLFRETPLVQRRVSGNSAAGIGTAPPIIQDVLSSPGQPLDVASRAFFEPRFEHDFGHVRVHRDTQAMQSAGEISALAYTTSTDVVFGPGQYAPETASGKRLLAHELSHVIQQSATPENGCLQRAAGDDPVAEKESEPISLETGISGTHEIVINGKPYELLVNPDLAYVRTLNKSLHQEIVEHLGAYPQLDSGVYAFILEPNSRITCQLSGNCLGWAKGTFAFIDPVGGVWNKRPEYLESIGVEVPTGRAPDQVYVEKVNSAEISPQAIWDYFMKVEFNALPTDSEATASFALYGSGFRLQSEGPTHIAFRPKGGMFWLSKPSDKSKPVLHQSASQMAGGQIGEIIRLYKRESGAVDHIYMKAKNSQSK